MKILILGASGQTGRELVRQALAHGHTVTAFVRDPARLRPGDPRVRVFQGDVTDRASVQRAVQEQDAVLCALGAPSPFRRDPELTAGICNVLQAMEGAGVRRFVYESFLGVPESAEQLGPLLSRVAPRLLRHPTRDHEVKEGMVKRSALDWVIVRAPKLTNGRLTRAYRSGERLTSRSLFPAISRADVADFMLRQLGDTGQVGKAVSVMR